MLKRENVLKTLLIIALVGLVLVAAVGCRGGQTQKASNQAENNQNDKQNQTTGPKVLYFTADWWPSCREIKPLVEQAKNEYKDKLPFIVYDVDTQEGMDMAGKYGIGSIPALIFIDSEGSVANKLIGIVNKDVIDQNIEDITK